MNWNELLNYLQNFLFNVSLEAAYLKKLIISCFYTLINKWFYKEISMICDRLKIKPKELCYYPDKIRRKLEEEYYEGNEIEQEII